MGFIVLCLIFFQKHEFQVAHLKEENRKEVVLSVDYMPTIEDLIKKRVFVCSSEQVLASRQNQEGKRPS